MARGCRQTCENRGAATFFGAVLCLLLAFFAVERRVAAYPSTHSVASMTTVATGVQKPEQISFDEPQTLHVPVLVACILVLLTARDGWGRQIRPVARLGFYVRSHWLRMPPLMLARHLWTKWRKEPG